jgi:predicted RNase H-like HicB family nuclease
MSEYVVIYEQAEDGGWGAYLPDLPGVVALGDSRRQVEERISEAVTIYLEEAGEAGLPREPASAAGTISI